MLDRFIGYVRFLLSLNINTVRFNFKYFDFKTAIKFPVKVSSNVYLKKLSGSVSLDFKWYTSDILLGYGEVGIFDKQNSRSIWELNTGNVIFKGTANIGHGFKLSINNGNVIFGNNFRISAESTIVSTDASIIFGNNNLLSWDIIVMNSDLHPLFNSLNEHINPARDIVFGDDIWIGCRATVLKGSHVADGCVIAAGSLVAGKFLNKSSLIGGHPSKEVKSDISWRCS